MPIVVTGCREVIGDAVVTTQGCVVLQTDYVDGMMKLAPAVPTGGVSGDANVTLTARQVLIVTEPGTRKYNPLVRTCSKGQLFETVFLFVI